ncbi:MAG: peptidylprolyl isomerase, partial [Acidobacteriota bacterium]
EHSQSSTAAEGGLVQNQRPSRLDETTRRALAALAEGEVSPVVESRTGLHLFKLERRLTPPAPSREQLERQARVGLAREKAAAARSELLTELRERIEVATKGFPWRVGSFEVTAADLEWMPEASGADDALEQLVVEQLLLAEEGRARGLLTAELEARVDQQLRGQLIRARYEEHRADYIATLPADRLRSLYEARPAAFALPETAHLDLIFVAQGGDPFTTQRKLEDHVAELRAGASFAELARQISIGPAAEQGGDLGALPPSEWVRLGPEIYKAVTTLQPGDVSSPIYHTERILTADTRTLRGGFAIVRVRAKAPPRERSFDEAIDDLRTAYAGHHAAEIDREVRARILAEADFTVVRLPTADELLL